MKRDKRWIILRTQGPNPKFDESWRRPFCEHPLVWYHRVHSVGLSPECARCAISLPCAFFRFYDLQNTPGPHCFWIGRLFDYTHLLLYGLELGKQNSLYKAAFLEEGGGYQLHAEGYKTRTILFPVLSTADTSISKEAAGFEIV